MKDGFKLDLFNKEAGINRSTGELLPPDWLGTKSCLYLIQINLRKEHCLCVSNDYWVFTRLQLDQKAKINKYSFSIVLVSLSFGKILWCPREEKY